jgi:hypothetical protein
MTMRKRRHALLALAAASILGAAAFFGMTGSARADYGQGAQYQVEISANPPGFGFWYWAELDPSMTSGDYQETDCIHSGHGGPNGGIHDSGSVTGWEIVGGVLTMHDVLVVGGIETVDVSVPVPSGGYGHSNSVTITPVSGPPLIAGTFPAQVQLAP